MIYEPENDEERAFLAAYRRRDDPRPAVTADVAAFARLDEQLRVLLIRRGGFPARGRWALPGGFVEVGNAFDDQGEDLDSAAARELAEECGFAPGSVRLRQLHTYGAPHRDPRTRIITVVYLAVLPPQLARQARAGDDAAAARWVPFEELPGLELAFDHDQIVAQAIDALRDLSERSGVLRPLLPGSFTQAALRALHQQLWGQRFDARRFKTVFDRQRRDGLLKVVGRQKPARYRYTQR